MSQYQGEHRSTLTTSTSTAGHLVSSETSESSFFFDRDMTAFTVSPRDMMVYDGPSSHGFTPVDSPRTLRTESVPIQTHPQSTARQDQDQARHLFSG